ncbi:hypothetical protein [Neobacillus sp. LXY-1]|uniref:hypothetical protein n=1 Tax=Neobacillus sp. LXY-1 TaxID=3379133 RepID=UPI003EE11C45
MYFPYYLMHPVLTAQPGYMINVQFPRTYPPVDTKIFESSIKSFRLLMEQGSLLLDRLSNVSFAHKIMTFAQQGKKAEVDQLIQSTGLKVPVTTKFTPSGVELMLTAKGSQTTFGNCCTLTINLKWGQ